MTATPFIVGSFLTSVGVAVELPIALTEGGEAALITGAFAALNIILNTVMIIFVSRVNSKVERTRQIVDRRNEQELPPPDGEWKRQDDPPKEIE